MFIVLPIFQKRVVAKMHLLKDENGLGIHIAGGRGSKKGDIGIFVAGITEGGAAFRWAEYLHLKERKIECYIV